MHTRRFTTLLLGAWLAGTLLMGAVAIGGFQGVDRLLAEPGMAANQYIKVLGTNSARTLLRHQVSELNRYYFDSWEIVQLVLGVVLAVTLLFITNGNRYYMAGAAVLLLIVIAQHWLLTPQLTGLGREIDFLPADAPSDERIRVGRVHSAYMALDLLKIVLIGGIATRLLVISSRRRGRVRKEVDPVDDADNG
jgi:hypothetical protein